MGVFSGRFAVSMMIEDLEDKLQRAHVAERGSIGAESLEAESRALIDSIRTQLDRELRVIALEGQMNADAFWERSREEREAGSEPCYIGTRVRLLRNTVTFEWFRNRTAPGAGEGKPRAVYSTYLKKGKGDRYPSRYFDREPEWAKQEINDTEDRYEQLRKRVAILASVRKNIRDYESLINKQFNKLGKAKVKV